MDAIYRVDGNRVDTSPDAAGPWDSSMQHGSAPAALVVWAAEAIPTPQPMRIARVTIDLMRPVPIAPLSLETEILREGRKIQLCAVRLRAENVVVVAATVLKIKTQALALPPEAINPAVELPGPDQAREEQPSFSTSPFVAGISMRAARAGSACRARARSGIGSTCRWSKARRYRRRCGRWSQLISATAPPRCWTSGNGLSSMPTSP
jgi:hypothetical protein